MQDKKETVHPLEKMGNGFMRLMEMLIDRLRLNVVIIAVLVTFMIVDFGDKLIEKLPADIGPEVLALLIGTGIGGLIATLMRMFEGPSVPADVHERAIKAMLEAMRRSDKE